MRQILAVAALTMLLACVLSPQPVRADRDERWDGLVAACVERGETYADLEQCKGAASTPCIRADDTTIGMSLCLSNEADQWDALLTPLIERARMREPERAESLQASQASWTAWADAECSYQASAAMGGSAQQPMLAACYRDLTADRVITFEMNERNPP